MKEDLREFIEPRGIKYQRRPNFWETIKEMIVHVANKNKQ